MFQTTNQSWFGKSLIFLNCPNASSVNRPTLGTDNVKTTWSCRGRVPHWLPVANSKHSLY